MINETSKSNDQSTFQDFIRKFNALDSVFESMPTGVFAILDKNMNIATITPQGQRDSGYGNRRGDGKKCTRDS